MHGHNPTDIGRKNAISDSRYLGAVCLKHPQLNGERRRNSYRCIGCIKDDRKRYKTQEHVAEKIKVEKRRGRESEMIKRKILRDQQTAIRLLAIRKAVKAGRDEALWQMFWVEAKEEYEAKLRETPAGSSE